eukprot:gnl/TRDRNA2_/TRDRNA2_164112_c0_seq1.p1 gnl/TRDRNA2_/TRDRNA2_164112_c0~~gnl/TRDRNA2_/TRDRNA2_164112_c0_seq1.p1  ORF type:complete len:152 (+),score=23.26 gnl/TRDRNA2_/TRDRNA2_164112_c0_seq1:96-551(+)
MSTTFASIVILIAMVSAAAAEHDKSSCIGDNCDEGNSADEVSMLQVKRERQDDEIHDIMSHYTFSKSEVNGTVSERYVFSGQRPKCTKCRALSGGGHVQCGAAFLMNGGCPDSITITGGAPQSSSTYSMTHQCCCADGDLPLLPRACINKK